MKQSLILALTLLFVSSPLCFGQEKDAKNHAEKGRSRKHKFKLKLDLGKAQNWGAFFREQKALTVVKTKKGLYSVNFGLKTVQKKISSISDLEKKYERSPNPLGSAKALTAPLYAFLEALGHGPKEAMSTMLFLPKGTLRSLEAKVEAACYQRFIPVKDVVAATIRFRGGKLTVGPIEFLEQGKLRRY